MWIVNGCFLAVGIELRVSSMIEIVWTPKPKILTLLTWPG